MLKKKRKNLKKKRLPRLLTIFLIFFRDDNVLGKYKVPLHASDHSIVALPKLKTFFSDHFVSPCLGSLNGAPPKLKGLVVHVPKSHNVILRK